MYIIYQTVVVTPTKTKCHYHRSHHIYVNNNLGPFNGWEK